MLELEKNKNQRERIKVTKATIQERMNNCTNRQDNSLFYVNDKQEARKNNLFFKKIIVSIIIFGILYAMSMVNYPFVKKALAEVQTVYEMQTNLNKTAHVFESIGGSLNEIMDIKHK